MFIQQEGGTRKTIEKGLAVVGLMRERLKDTKRKPMGIRDLIIGQSAEGLITPAGWPEMWWWDGFSTG